MTNLLEVLNTAAIKGGIPADSAELKNLLSIGTLATTEIPASVGKAITEGLMNLEAAKSNFELQKHFKKTLLTPMDNKLFELAQEAEADESDLNALKDQINSYEKPNVLKEVVKKLKEKAKQAQKSGDTDAVKDFKEQITNLNKVISEKEEAIKQVKADSAKEIQSYKLKHQKAGLMNSFTWSDVYAPEYREIIFDKAFEDELNAIGGAVIIREDKAVLVRKDNPESEVFDSSHKKVELFDIANRIAQKFQKVSDTTTTKTTITVPSTGKNNTVDNSTKMTPEAQEAAARWQAKLGINA